MKRERMLEFLRELGLDPSKTINVHLDSSGWFAEQFALDADGKKVLPEDSVVRKVIGHVTDHLNPVAYLELSDRLVSGDWE